MEHKTISLADQVFERLETDILSGKYQKGEVFTEMKLTAELGVSRTPVREALRRLEAEHIIEDTPRGMMVVGIGKQDLIDIYTIREAIEGLCVRKVVEHITDEQLAAAGIDGGLIRFSCGLENIEDILADAKQALDNI